MTAETEAGGRRSDRIGRALSLLCADCAALLAHAIEDAAALGLGTAAITEALDRRHEADAAVRGARRLARSGMG
ncbi:MAG: hypothetical protein HY699_13005 [Deltaproteobacteria bacterium]|nr:hypothetical protein [Deltaproteobacteria bacterium]